MKKNRLLKLIASVILVAVLAISIPLMSGCAAPAPTPEPTPTPAPGEPIKIGAPLPITGAMAGDGVGSTGSGITSLPQKTLTLQKI